MIQQPHCWAYTLRKPEVKETCVPQCIRILYQLSYQGSPFPILIDDINILLVLQIHNFNLTSIFFFLFTTLNYLYVLHWWITWWSYIKISPICLFFFLFLKQSSLDLISFHLYRCHKLQIGLAITGSALLSPFFMLKIHFSIISAQNLP